MACPDGIAPLRSGLLLCLWASLACLQAQVPENSREGLQQRIALTEQLLQETQDQRERSLIELGLLNRQIRHRKQLLTYYADEIETAQTRIQSLQEEIDCLAEDRQRLIKSYGRIAQLAYQRFNEQNFWLFLLSAQSITEAYYRTRYVRQLGTYRKQQVALIQESARHLKQQQTTLEEYRASHQRLLDEQATEVARLQQTEKVQNRLYNRLKRRESVYRKQLREQQEELKLLIGQADPDFSVTEAMENNEIGQAFEQNRGFHPWPVNPKRAVVIQAYGITEDPFGNRIESDGIDLRTPQGEEVRAVYGGRVTGVKGLLQSGMVVILQHGNYRTVYANLSEVQVQEGDFVTAAQPLGTVTTDPRTGQTVLRFLIYKVPRAFVDPLSWLFPQ